MCLPTSPRVAPLIDTPQGELEDRIRAQAMSLLCIAGLAGLPQVSLPLATLDGLPLGFSLVGPWGIRPPIACLGPADDGAGPGFLMQVRFR